MSNLWSIEFNSSITVQAQSKYEIKTKITLWEIAKSDHCLLQQNGWLIHLHESTVRYKLRLLIENVEFWFPKAPVGRTVPLIQYSLSHSCNNYVVLRNALHVGNFRTVCDVSTLDEAMFQIVVSDILCLNSSIYALSDFWYTKTITSVKQYDHPFSIAHQSIFVRMAWNPWSSEL